MESVVALGVVASLAAVTSVARQRSLQRREAPTTARRAASERRLRRSQAVGRANAVGIALRRRGATWFVSAHEDGDGDGIRTDDMNRGIDRRIGDVQRFDDRYGEASPGFLPDLESLRSPPPVSQLLADLDDPVRFGRSDVISCGPRGTMTSGTLYMTDGRERQLALVVYGATGRLRLWEYDAARGAWRRF